MPAKQLTVASQPSTVKAKWARIASRKPSIAAASAADKFQTQAREVPSNQGDTMAATGGAGKSEQSRLSASQPTLFADLKSAGRLMHQLSTSSEAAGLSSHPPIRRASTFRA